ncbi:hypothetical protein [Polaribacter sp. Z022]|uniref:hypothetical protein n=1 Tax=Polaribacter sp. Z022 TaxID=2927125 RepID=UPI0020213189|nr:hypothetical protein [Polaribacter sp. Z022]MCL7752444.1 hypothetical protein [Polaribacter sp. Z022]
MKKIILVFVFLSISFACSKDDGFINTNTPPSKPQLITPRNNSTITQYDIKEPIYFEWTKSTDPDNDLRGYKFYYDDNPNFNSPSFFGLTENFTHTNTEQYSTPRPELTPNTTYYWYVEASDSNNNISSSEVGSFYIEDANKPSVPTLIFPLHETECSNDNLTFDWEDSTVLSNDDVSYKLHISTSSTFDNNIDIYETDISKYNIVLPQSTALYWKVEAINNINPQSTFSTTRSLYTQGDGVTNTIPQIKYLSPDEGSTLSTQTVELKWEAEDNETSNSDLSYKVYFSEAGQDLELKTETTNILSYQINGLEVGKTYQWSIWVTDGDGATNVGDVFTFTIN